MIFCTGLEVRDVKRKYALEEAKKTGHSPEIEVLAYNTKEDFEQDSVGIVEDTDYDYRGQMRLFLIHTPAYEHDSDVHLDDLWD
jgi:hypothetical protein